MYQRFDTDVMDDLFDENDGFLDDFDGMDADYAAPPGRNPRMRRLQQRNVQRPSTASGGTRMHMQSPLSSHLESRAGNYVNIARTAAERLRRFLRATPRNDLQIRIEINHIQNNVLPRVQRLIRELGGTNPALRTRLEQVESELRSVLAQSPSSGNQFDEFDFLEDEDFDAASPNVRRQRARAEQQRRRRLAKQQRRARRQVRRSQTSPSRRSTPIVPPPPSTQRALPLGRPEASTLDVPPLSTRRSPPLGRPEASTLDVPPPSTRRSPPLGRPEASTLDVPPPSTQRSPWTRFDEFDEFESDYAAPSEAGAAFRRATEIARGIGERGRQQLRDAARQTRQAVRRARHTIDQIFRDANQQNNQFDGLTEDDFIDEAAPAIARLTVNSIMPRAVNLPAPVRSQIVRSVASATRMLANQQGIQAVRAIPEIVASVQRHAQQHRLPVRALPQAIQRTATRVATSPSLTRRLAQTPSRGQAVRYGTTDKG